MIPLRSRIIAAISIGSFVLAAGCGGGGRSNVKIGGSISGLVGTVILQDNAGDNLTVSANGTFEFSTPINKGDAYTVTVLRQPPGPSCVVSNGSGMASADVNNVSVTCTTDPATMFLPLTANAGAASAYNGLFVITSKALADAPIQITAENIGSLGMVRRYTLNSSGTLSNGGTPDSLIYTTVNPTSSGRVWLLSLSGSSTLVPRQLGSLTIPYSTNGSIGGVPIPAPYCASETILKNLTDPSSAFLLLELPGEGTNCANRASIKWLLIHSQDAPDTAPLNVTELSSSTFADPGYTPVLPLYRPDGVLTGLVALDNSANLNFYSDETFTNPVRLLANVNGFQAKQASPLSYRANVSAEPGYSYLFVQTLASAASSAKSVYRVDYSGTISADLYDSRTMFLGGVVDSGNLYFTDSTSTPQGLITSVGQIPSGGAAQILYAPATPAASPGDLQGVSGAYLVFRKVTDNPVATSFATLPVGTPATPTTIASYSDIADLLLAGGRLFVTLRNLTQTQILDDVGSVLQPELAGSAFFSLFNSPGDPVLQVRNTPDVGEVYALDPSQPGAPTAALLKSTDGAPFNLPSYANSTGLVPITANVGVGETAVSSGTPRMGLVYDLAKGVMTTVSIPNADVQFVEN